MQKFILISFAIVFFVFSFACSTSYKAEPLSFKLPNAYSNAVSIAGAQIAAVAYTNSEETEKIFGFNVIGAGLLPVQVIIDNKGPHILKINGAQSFLEDDQSNLWSVLDKNTAYDRASKYAETKQTFNEAAHKGLLGAALGSVIGAAIGVVTGENVGSALGKGAAVGGALGATGGGVSGYNSVEAQQRITNDLRQKSLQNKPIKPGIIAHGVLFFPAEAKTAKQLRLQIEEEDTGNLVTMELKL